MLRNSLYIWLHKQGNMYNFKFMNITFVKLCSYVLGCELNKGGM